MNEIIKQALKWMRDTANDDTHGYDQTHRNGPNYDCSSAIITAYRSAGVDTGATYTGNMYENFKRHGFTDVTQTVNFATQNGLCEGDVLLTPHQHTAMYNGAGTIVHAGSNERGRATGGKSGDQTGKEFCIRPYYNYPWVYCLRYTGNGEIPKKVVNDVIKGKYGNGAIRRKRLAMEGYDYDLVQREVNRILKGR